MRRSQRSGLLEEAWRAPIYIEGMSLNNDGHRSGKNERRIREHGAAAGVESMSCLYEWENN